MKITVKMTLNELLKPGREIYVKSISNRTVKATVTGMDRDSYDEYLLYEYDEAGNHMAVKALINEYTEVDVETDI